MSYFIYTYIYIKYDVYNVYNVYMYMIMYIYIYIYIYISFAVIIRACIIKGCVKC